MAEVKNRSFIDFLKDEYDMDWATWIKLGESTSQIDIDFIEEILDSYEKESGES